MSFLDVFYPRDPIEQLPARVAISERILEPKGPEQPLFVIHPYFHFKHANGVQTLAVERGDCIPAEYVLNLEQLILHHKGPVITLEENGRCLQTLRRYAEFGRDAEVYAVPTHQQDPYPREGWDVLSFLTRRFSGRPVLLAGGQNNPPKQCKDDAVGCLTIVAGMLKGRGIDYAIRTDATFSRCLDRNTCKNLSYGSIVTGLGKHISRGMTPPDYGAVSGHR